MKKAISLMLALALMMASLAGCSGSSDSQTESSLTESSTAAADALKLGNLSFTYSVEDAKQILENFDASKVDVLADGVMTVGDNLAFPPFEMIDDNGEATGFDIELIKAIGSQLGVDVEINDMEFGTIIASIGSKIDISIAGMTITQERLQQVDFSDAYYEAVQYVLVAKDSPIKTAADLEGKTIGCQLGTTGDFMVEEINGATNKQYDKAVQAVQDLLAGRLDAIILDKNPAQVFAGQYPEELVALDGAMFEFSPEYYGIALPKGDTEFVNAVNAALVVLIDNGTYDQLVTQFIEEQ